MVEAEHVALPIVRQCQLLSISRSSYYEACAGESEVNLTLMRVIDEKFLQMPWYGGRQMTRHLRRFGHEVGRKRVKRLMRKMGLEAVYQRPKTTNAHPEHGIWLVIAGIGQLEAQNSRRSGRRRLRERAFRRCGDGEQAGGQDYGSGVVEHRRALRSPDHFALASPASRRAKPH